VARIALIGGTGAGVLVPAEARFVEVGSRYGAASGPVRAWLRRDHEFLFLPRHGLPPAIPPHRVNYRANVDVVAGLRPDLVIAINAVGGIAPHCRAGRLAVPDQLIDYTWGREQTFFEGGEGGPVHVEFDPPFAPAAREALLQAARRSGLDVVAAGTYGVTQGPRLETAAEIARLARDGCDLVGMTAMPEAALARERGLAYAMLCVVVNPAAGRGPPGEGLLTGIEAAAATGLRQVARLLDALPAGSGLQAG
jgi:5'-methylthioinosine phosphorylase